MPIPCPMAIDTPGSNHMRVLVLEDELGLQKQLVERLQSTGYAVDACATGEEALYLGGEIPYDVAIVDIGLPDISGITVIETWRQQAQTFPVLILTAQGRWQQKVAGLEAGADDYLVKPFHMEELIARIKGLIRRSAGQARSVVSYGSITINLFAQTVMVEEKLIELTAYEYKVLEYLILHHEKVISKSELTEHVYAQDFDRDSNVIEVFIRRLRRKLDPDNQLNPIETLRGRGYRFVLAKSMS